MSGTDDRADKTLPVTAEVGDEGGSYADPTNQAETFAGPEGNRRVDADRVAAAPPGRVAGGVSSEARQDHDDEPGVKHATEPPDRSS